MALITPFATKCADFFNERLTEGAKTDWDRKTTRGEVVQFWGYLVALALNPSVPVADAWAAKIGNRDLVLNVEVLNPTLCLISGVLPAAPSGGVAVNFLNGNDNSPNPAGRYLVGDNPVIDVVIPSDMTDGYLFISALDVSGNVFHLLPNLLMTDNSVEGLRGGRDGPVTVRVAYPLDEAADGSKLAFTVDDSTLGKTQIVVIHADDQIFDGLRPTTESAGGYASALENASGTVRSLDSAILTTAAR